jgi:hypothetical protein
MKFANCHGDFSARSEALGSPSMAEEKEKYDSVLRSSENGDYTWD